MNERIQKHYDEKYAREDDVFGAGEPTKIATLIPNYISSGTVLEIGAGQGRNALFLVEKGFDVEATDLSSKGIEKLNERAEQEGLNITGRVADMRDGIDKTYDVILTTFTLHHLTTNEALDVIDDMKKHTAPNGLNVITTFTKEGDFYEINPATKHFYPALGELRDLYSDWEVVEYGEHQNLAHHKREDGTPMQNIAAKIIARNT